MSKRDAVAAPAPKRKWDAVKVSDDDIFGLQGEGFMSLAKLTDYDVVYEDGVPRVVYGEAAPDTNPASKPEKKKKKAKKGKKDAPATDEPKESVEHVAAAPRVDTSAWVELGLPSAIVAALGTLGFSQPTPIQIAAIPPALGERKDILGAAETGSGKTLAFGLPMLADILQRRKEPGTRERKLLGLVVTPTRELALQVCAHLTAIAKQCAIKVVTVVGGLSLQKQNRLLASQPEVVVATPGRLWELITQHHEHFADLHKLRYLVIDEADRMVDKGHFEELDNILDRVRSHRKAQGFIDASEESLVGQAEAEAESTVEGDEDDIGMAASDDGDDDIAAAGDNGADAEAPEDDEDAWMDDATAEAAGDDATTAVDDADGAEISEEPAGGEDSAAADGFDGEAVEGAEAAGADEVEADEAQAADDADVAEERVQRQVFVFSATLQLRDALPHRGHQKKKKKHQLGSLQKIITKAGVRKNHVVVDLTPSGSATLAGSSAPKAAVAGGVVESRVFCVNDEKDAYLYYFLQRYPGRTMIFVNSIDCGRRLVALLQVLRFRPLALHAHLQQRQRLKNLDRFREWDNAILVATDVAARGLDIPKVQHVVHYQIPRHTDIYIHRSGRTARAQSEGLSFALVCPEEMSNYTKITKELSKAVPVFPVELKYLPEIKRRLAAAVALDKAMHSKKMKHHKNDWLRRNAEAMDMELDEDLLEDEDSEAPAKIARLKATLDAMLDEPLMRERAGLVTTSLLGMPSRSQIALDATQSSAIEALRTKKQHKKGKK
eukprot:m.222913 g.222913  ORF g.222913 m.222913 type:complete len:778 (-) comp10849_c0_seq1:784-3117(-)